MNVIMSTELEEKVKINSLLSYKINVVAKELSYCFNFFILTNSQTEECYASEQLSVVLYLYIAGGPKTSRLVY